MTNERENKNPGLDSRENQESMVKSRKKLYTRAAAAVAFLVICAVVWNVFLKTTPVFEHQTIQAGTQVSASVEDYLKGGEWILGTAKLDTSGVDVNAPGQYQIFCKVFYKKYEYIVDVVASAFETKEMELGSAVAENISEYLLGDETFLQTAVLDISGVDKDQIGDYQAYAEIDGLAYTYTIHVIDTTAPEVEFHDNLACFAAYTDYGTDAFIKDVFDLSNDVKIFFVENGEYVETLAMTSVGMHTLDFYVEDSSGNCTEVELRVNVDLPPALIGAFDTCVAAGGEYHALDGVFAYDNLEGDITSKISVDTSGVNIDKVGEYELIYTVTDSNHLTTTRVAKLIVCEEEDISGFEGLNEKALSEIDLQLLCGSGYFTYQPLEEPDYEKTLEIVKPTLLNLRNDKGAGSGFIIKIEPEYLYAISVEHVTRTQYKNTKLVFHDDVGIDTSFDYLRLEAPNEIVLFRIPIEEVPYETLVSLKQIHVELDIYDTLETGAPLIEYCSNWGYTNYDDEIREVTLIEEVASFLLSKPNLWFEDTCITTTRKAKSGMSGTAVVDYCGSLAGVLAGTEQRYDGGTSKDYHLRVDKLRLFEDMIGVWDEQETE